MADQTSVGELTVGAYLTDEQALLVIVGDSGANGKLVENVLTGDVKGYAVGELQEMRLVSPSDA